MQHKQLSLVLLLALALSTFYAYREHLVARSLAAQLRAQREQGDNRAGLVNRSSWSSAVESPRAPAPPPRANRVISDPAAVVPPLSSMAFDTKDDVEDLLDIQRFFVPTLMQLGLSGEQVANVRSLLLEARQSSRDAVEVAREHRWSSADIAIKAMKGAVTNFDPQIRAAVGDANFQQVHTMLADATYFRRVEFNIEPNAELFGQPLSAEQKLALTRAMAGVLSQPGQSHTAADPQTGLTSSDQQIIDIASGALSDAQIAMLRRYFARQHLSTAKFPSVASKSTNK